jgi:hypothetical protein
VVAGRVSPAASLAEEHEQLGWRRRRPGEGMHASTDSGSSAEDEALQVERRVWAGRQGCGTEFFGGYEREYASSAASGCFTTEPETATEQEARGMSRAGAAHCLARSSKLPPRVSV